uniref:metallophosphoesterase family protein n=1 Tax=Methylobacterium sp. TaxID=409 RepID=UPI0020C8731F|nr:metallophosphoesterase [Methylobacterium sp.]USU34558.1 metallophosphoesterase [Methylobacterium sp.]
MKVLVVSDLHAHSGSAAEGAAPSFLYAKKDPSQTDRSVISLIGDILEEESITVDLLLCPGDIADKADPTAQRFAWGELLALKKRVGAKAIIASAGNHDVDSRMKFSTYDPKGALQTLKPPFPGLDEKACDKYWSRNFHIYTSGTIRLVNLNSSAFHGYHSDEPKDTLKSEYHHGRVSNITIDNICQSIAKSNYKTNILLTHHHIYKNQHIYDEDYSEMVFGSKLLDRLMAETDSSWLVIHGHQHFPEISYSRGTSNSSVIFSAGSVSASLIAPYSSEATNQFYVIEVEQNDQITKGWSPCGTVRAWHWANRRQWVKSNLSQAIAYGTGFGCRALPADLARDIVQAFHATGKVYLTGADIYGLVPHTKFVTKEHMNQVLSAIRNSGLSWTSSETFAEGILRK